MRGRSCRLAGRHIAEWVSGVPSCRSRIQWSMILLRMVSGRAPCSRMAA